jgi:hypothetical protein
MFLFVGRNKKRKYERKGKKDGLKGNVQQDIWWNSIDRSLIKGEVLRFLADFM